MSIAKNVIKYPKDVFTSQTKNATFSVESKISPKKMGEKSTVTNDNEYAESPLKILSEFSGYRLSIVDKDGINANLSIKDLHKLTRRANYAYKKQLDIENNTENSDSQNSTPAFTVRFKMGQLKGKTPIDVLMENGKEKGAEILRNQYSFLKESSEKNPKFASENNKIMAAIKEAAQIDFSTLDVKKSTVKSMQVLDSGMKGSYRSKQDENGLHLCSQIQIIWDFNNDYPVTVTLTNLSCPIIPPKDGGGQIIKMSEGKNRKTKSFNLSADDFMDAIYCMNSDLNCFNNMMYKKAYDLSNEALFANMKKD